MDPVTDHHKWFRDIEQSQGHAVTYPLVGDPTLAVVKLYDMLPAESGDSCVGRTAADNATARVGVHHRPRQADQGDAHYPMTAGRNFGEILRLLDSLQLTAAKKVATPANWSMGEDVIILPSVSDADAKQAFPEGWRTPLPYMRVVAQPR